MVTRLRRGLRFLERKIGWSRIGFALSLTIIVVAAAVLYHILRDLDVDELLRALKATDWQTLIIAGLFVAAGYLTLTFYDLFALRTIGRSEIPYRTAALAGFTSYAIGHNVGASVFSGGAVRYRIYSGCGLSVIEVTKICFVAGLTFWLGNATVLGLG
ncbi:MAG: YbhN family protein, partial [Xanthobacteraceae bacterium]